MKICIVNGSPKGKYSITLHTCLYLQKLVPEHEYTYLDAGQKIKLYENDFSGCKQALEEADLILFSYPVYTFIVPSQLHRFIELMKEHEVNVKGKFATQISTSKHFYDVTAHDFIRDNCADLELKYIKGLSADMEDLLSEKGRQDAATFWKYVLWCVENDIHEILEKPYISAKHFPVSVAGENDVIKRDDEVVIVTDLCKDDVQLQSMIDRFSARLPYKTKLVNIHDFPFKGGCISCFNCAVDGKCIYNDGFDSYLRDNIQTGKAIVIAFSIKDHSMGSTFKLYDDRQFCNGHRTVTMGMPFGYLVSGDLSREDNLRTIIRARAEVGGNFLAGVATDEVDPDKEIDALAARLSYAIENHYVQPSNFYGVGGMKIFRDLIWTMQGLMKADHKFYKSHGQYDFPQKHRGKMMAMYLVGAMMANKKIKSKIGNQMNEGMIGPYRKVLEKIDLDKEIL